MPRFPSHTFHGFDQQEQGGRENGLEKVVDQSGSLSFEDMAPGLEGHPGGQATQECPQGVRKRQAGDAIGRPSHREHEDGHEGCQKRIQTEIIGQGEQDEGHRPRGMAPGEWDGEPTQGDQDGESNQRDPEKMSSLTSRGSMIRSIELQLLPKRFHLNSIAF
jgi:hypothetical protein